VKVVPELLAPEEGCKEEFFGEAHADSDISNAASSNSVARDPFFMVHSSLTV
jgi:hypothetical protein